MCEELLNWQSSRKVPPYDVEDPIPVHGQKIGEENRRVQAKLQNNVYLIWQSGHSEVLLMMVWKMPSRSTASTVPSWPVWE